MNYLNHSNISWSTATKTKNIKAKPLISLMIDRSVASKFLLATIEGNEPLGDGAVVCIGECNDAWQQMPKKLLQKYNVIAIDEDGWMVCEPRPDNAVWCYEVTPAILEANSITGTTFHIYGLWGQAVEDGKFAQRGEAGDFICMNCTDPSDVWVVNRKIFLNTYSITSP